MEQTYSTYRRPMMVDRRELRHNQFYSVTWTEAGRRSTAILVNEIVAENWAATVAKSLSHCASHMVTHPAPDSKLWLDSKPDRRMASRTWHCVVWPRAQRSSQWYMLFGGWRNVGSLFLIVSPNLLWAQAFVIWRPWMIPGSRHWMTLIIYIKHQWATPNCANGKLSSKTNKQLRR
jgi:hypothetical protein